MKTIIAGSRTITSSRLLYDIIDAWHKTMPITEVVSGTAKGIDSLGEKWAEVHGIPIRQFRPNWDDGPKGGPERNQKMADYAECLIAFSVNNSRGTADMIRKAKENGLKILEIHL